MHPPASEGVRLVLCLPSTGHGDVRLIDLKPFDGRRGSGYENGDLLRRANSAAVGIAVDMNGCDHFYWLARNGRALLMLTVVAAILASCVTSNDQGGGRR